MSTSRLEAFSDGVLAIIITIMVLTLDVPSGDTFRALWDEIGPSLLTYVLSFTYVGIYWNNHHHLFQFVDRLPGIALWANLHLLFWLSLLPLTTAWMDSTDFARIPTMVYGIDLAAAAIAYALLQTAIVHGRGGTPELATALGRDLKGKLSPIIYGVAIVITIVAVPAWRPAIWMAVACYVGVAVMWLIPDRRIERFLETRS